MAPELVSDPERVSEKADVWSLGMVLWEMLTRQVPFTHLTPQQIIAGLMVGNLQPEVCMQLVPFVTTTCRGKCIEYASTGNKSEQTQSKGNVIHKTSVWFVSLGLLPVDADFSYCPIYTWS